MSGNNKEQKSMKLKGKKIMKQKHCSLTNTCKTDHHHSKEKKEKKHITTVRSEIKDITSDPADIKG